MLGLKALILLWGVCLGAFSESHEAWARGEGLQWVLGAQLDRQIKACCGTTPVCYRSGVQCLADISRRQGELATDSLQKALALIPHSFQQEASVACASKEGVSFWACVVWKWEQKQNQLGWKPLQLKLFFDEALAQGHLLRRAQDRCEQELKSFHEHPPVLGDEVERVRDRRMAEPVCNGRWSVPTGWELIPRRDSRFEKKWDSEALESWVRAHEGVWPSAWERCTPADREKLGREQVDRLILSLRESYLMRIHGLGEKKKSEVQEWLESRSPELSFDYETHDLREKDLQDRKLFLAFARQRNAQVELNRGAATRTPELTAAESILQKGGDDALNLLYWAMREQPEVALEKWGLGAEGCSLLHELAYPLQPRNLGKLNLKVVQALAQLGSEPLAGSAELAIQEGMLTEYLCRDHRVCVKSLSGGILDWLEFRAFQKVAHEKEIWKEAHARRVVVKAAPPEVKVSAQKVIAAPSRTVPQTSSKADAVLVKVAVSPPSEAPSPPVPVVLPEESDELLRSWESWDAGHREFALQARDKIEERIAKGDALTGNDWNARVLEGDEGKGMWAAYRVDRALQLMRVPPIVPRTELKYRQALPKKYVAVQSAELDTLSAEWKLLDYLIAHPLRKSRPQSVKKSGVHGRLWLDGTEQAWGESPAWAAQEVAQALISNRDLLARWGRLDLESLIKDLSSALEPEKVAHFKKRAEQLEERVQLLRKITD